jgi:hypothetical protein
MCVKIYLDLHTSSVKTRLTIQLIWFADFSYNSLANYLHTIWTGLLSRAAVPSAAAAAAAHQQSRDEV